MINEELNKFPDIFVIYRNDLDTSKNSEWRERWKKMRKYNECDEQMKKECNLRKIFPNEIVLDFDENFDINKIKEKLIEKKLKYYLYETGSRGVHISLYFIDLENHEIDIRNEIRRLVIEQFAADKAKNSELTLLAMENKPHFKTGREKKLVEAVEGLNGIDLKLLEEARENVEYRKTLKTPTDVNYKDYHLKDSFFKLIQTKIIEDSSGRNNTIFKNVALALVKEGLDDEQIEVVMKPIISKNFPGKSYAEFHGWIKKSRDGSIKEYNLQELNKWCSQNNYIPQYNLEVMEEAEKLKDNIPMIKRIISQEDLDKLDLKPTEYIVDKILPACAVSLFVGKRNSFKSFFTQYLCLAIANGIKIFNEFQTKPVNILYIDEENGDSITKIRNRKILNGLALPNTNKIHYLFFNNIKFDRIEWTNEVKKLIIEKDITLVVLDTVRKCIDFDENDSREVSNFFTDRLRPLIVNYGVSFILIHHMRKGVLNSSSDDELSEVRGASEWSGASDAVMTFKMMANSTNKIIVEQRKTRYDVPISSKVIEIVNDGDKLMFNILEGEDALIEIDLKCAKMIETWITENEVKNFDTKHIVEQAKAQGFNANNIKGAINSLMMKGKIIKLKRGKFEVRETGEGLDSFVDVNENA